MSDLIERLRENPNYRHWLVMAEAADEIDRLQAKVAELEGALTEIEESGGMTLIGCCDHYGNCDCGSLGERAHEYGAYKAFNQSAQTARAALKGDT